MKTYLNMDEILRHCRRYIGQEYDEPYLVSAVPEEVIRSLPPADVRPVVRGEWLAVDDRNDAFDCSVCDAMVSKRLNFCPHCGADMRVRSDCESKT